MTTHTSTPRPQRLRARDAALASGASIAGWAWLLGRPRRESAFSRRMAHLGVLSAVVALLGYLAWRILTTLPAGGASLVVAWVLVAFEAFPLVGLVIRTITLWDIDCLGPDPVTEVVPGKRAAVFIPTYNEPAEVIAPTIAAACNLQPAHQTWVLDDGDRPWVQELCAEYGARYVRRDVHDHAKAGNMNHALGLMTSEIAAGAEEVDVIAVLDCDHVPLPTFLTDTLGWFDDPELALVQAPQAYFNEGAFDDDGDTGEQGLFFHVLMPARNHDGAGPFWCGSTSLIRVSALAGIGGISTATIVEDMHTTLNLLRAGWKTAYHHQVLAVGLAPDTPDQYLLQRRRWGMGSMQVLVRERLWAAKTWLSWRNYYEYLGGTLWWFEGVGTLGIFLIPLVILVSGVETSTADPLTYALVFLAMFCIRLWGVKRLFRKHVHWGTTLALRILRIPVGLSCLWWLVTRRTLQFQVTPKSGADQRSRGRAPRILWFLDGLVFAGVLYAVLGVTGWMPWHLTLTSTLASGSYLLLAALALFLAARRIRADQYASTRRNAFRAPVHAAVTVDGTEGRLVDLSVGGALVELEKGRLAESGPVELQLPGAAEPVAMEIVRVIPGPGLVDKVAVRAASGDWQALRTMSLWLFHTPVGVIDGIPDGVPAVAARARSRHGLPVLARQHG